MTYMHIAQVDLMRWIRSKMQSAPATSGDFQATNLSITERSCTMRKFYARKYYRGLGKRHGGQIVYSDAFAMIMSRTFEHILS